MYLKFKHFKICCKLNIGVFFKRHNLRGFNVNLYLITRIVHLSEMTCKHNFSLTDEPILMKLYTHVVYDLRVYMKEDKPGLK